MALFNTKHKKKSFTLTTLLLSVLLLLLFYIGLTYMDPPLESGITINFGTMEYGSGKVQPKEKIKSQPVNKPEVIEEKVQEQVPQEQVAEEKPIEKVLTQEDEESILIKQQQEAARKAKEAAKKAQAEADRIAREKKEAEEKIKREQEAKRNKLDQLIGGINKSDGAATGSEGDDNQTGDKGSPEGDPYATSYYGSPGAGTGSGGYGLKGRSLVNQGKVPQECNEEGRVVVRIVVNRNGDVVEATPGVKGTTNNHPCLLAPAKQTALMHKWNLDANAPSQQTGFVVVNFKLGE
ncbi:energy transducer TonB [Arenibacter lacus]|uniref:energy transducer TonB n=1 Tax=Arenibacter lacus TaxID=2608629 RepID=UPI00123E29BE|nr:energy transducer TonB [Arenibacter lacus]